MKVDQDELLRARAAYAPIGGGRQFALRSVVRWVALVSAALLMFALTLTLVYRVLTPPSTLMLGRWLTLKPVEWTPVPMDSMSPALLEAVIASEDQRFCMHHGVDWTSLSKVIGDAEGMRRGASTITMQTVKNVYLWPGRSFVRKALEIPLAFVVDTVWGKRRTMEIYLNVAEWGEGVFGAEAAARHWFKKSAKGLTRSEAAMLVAILPNPLTRNASKPTRAVRLQAMKIRSRMYGVDWLTGCLRA